MKYTDVFTTDINIIKDIIHDANIEIDSYVIVLLNEIIQNENEYILSEEQEQTVITEIKDNNCCLPFLFFCCHYETSVYINNKINLIMFLYNLTKEHIIMIAEYQNLYYKNRLITYVVKKEPWMSDEKKHIISWVYDNIYIYLYKRKYNHI